MENKKDLSSKHKNTLPPEISIYLGEGFAFILTDHLNVDIHHHNALQITLSITKGQPLQCNTIEGLVEGEVILIPPLASHAFHEKQGLVLVILADDESIVAETVKVAKVQSLELADFLELKIYLSNQTDSTDLPDVFFQTNFFKKFMKLAIDHRIKKLVAKLKEDETFVPTAVAASQICNLSESRFLHLFKNELGLPFRKYIQWTKLKRALKYLKMGHSLTEAAHAGGFSDSAHLSRYFRESFGLTPSEVLHNSQFIQAK